MTAPKCVCGHGPERHFEFDADREEWAELLGDDARHGCYHNHTVPCAPSPVDGKVYQWSVVVCDCDAWREAAAQGVLL